MSPPNKGPQTNEVQRLLEEIREAQRTGAGHRDDGILRVLEEIAGIKGEIIRLGGVINAHELVDNERHDNLKGTIERISGGVDKADAALEQSGQHEVARLEKALEKHEDSRVHWTRYVVTALIGAVLSAILIVFSVLVARSMSVPLPDEVPHASPGH